MTGPGNILASSVGQANVPPKHEQLQNGLDLIISGHLLFGQVMALNFHKTATKYPRT
jgi:hypothetical protein